MGKSIYQRVGDGNEIYFLERQAVCLPDSRIDERQIDYEEPKEARLKYFDESTVKHTPS